MRNYPDRFVRHGSGFVLFPLLLLVAACASTGGTSPPVPDLDGSRWVIVAIDGSVPLRGEEPLSVDFSVDGRISGNGGILALVKRRIEFYSGPMPARPQRRQASRKEKPQ